MCGTQWAHGTGRCHFHYYSDVGTPSPPQPQPNTILCQQQNGLFQTRTTILVLRRTDLCPRTDSKSNRLLGEGVGDNCFGPHTPFLMSLGGIWSLSWLFYSVNHWAGILELAFLPPTFSFFFFNYWLWIMPGNEEFRGCVCSIWLCTRCVRVPEK